MLGTLFSGRKQWTVVNCAVASIGIEKGRAAIRTALIDTEYSTVAAKGAANLASETLDLVVEPRAKSATLNIAVPVRVQGTFADPKFRPETGAALKKLGGLVGIALFPPAAVVGLGELGGSGNECLKIATARPKPGAAPQAGPVSPEKAVRELRDNLKGRRKGHRPRAEGPVRPQEGLMPRCSTQDSCLGALRRAPLPLGGRGWGRASRRDGRLCRASPAASAGAEAAPHPASPASGRGVCRRQSASVPVNDRWYKTPRRTHSWRYRRTLRQRLCRIAAVLPRLPCTACVGSVPEGPDPGVAEPFLLPRFVGKEPQNGIRHTPLSQNGASVSPNRRSCRPNRLRQKPQWHSAHVSGSARPSGIGSRI